MIASESGHMGCFIARSGLFFSAEEGDCKLMEESDMTKAIPTKAV